MKKTSPPSPSRNGSKNLHKKQIVTFVLKVRVKPPISGGEKEGRRLHRACKTEARLLGGGTEASAKIHGRKKPIASDFRK